MEIAYTASVRPDTGVTNLSAAPARASRATIPRVLPAASKPQRSTGTSLTSFGFSCLSSFTFCDWDLDLGTWDLGFPMRCPVCFNAATSDKTVRTGLNLGIFVPMGMTSIARQSRAGLQAGLGI